MAKPNSIELPGVEPIPILYEDRSVLAIDKPRGWMLVPFSWQRTSYNLQAAIASSIAAGDFWARSRGLKSLRAIHRLDADTTGILLFVKSQGAAEPLSELFESRRMEKTYLAVVSGVPKQTDWTCRLKLAPDPKLFGRMRVDARLGKEAETQFRVLQTSEGSHRREEANVSREKSDPTRRRPATPHSLIEARPLTGRTHQIRVHLAQSGCPVLGDELYGRREGRRGLGLRAVRLAYRDPFTRRAVDIRAPIEAFCREYGFDIPRI
ncbi:MAG: RNA pseudouridine synthase [Verrucomicrobiae bacterium]|nr:RNA pseudouridine synthase [Verrucomicrobiae bacterium]